MPESDQGSQSERKDLQQHLAKLANLKVRLEQAVLANAENPRARLPRKVLPNDGPCPLDIWLPCLFGAQPPRPLVLWLGHHADYRVGVQRVVAAKVLVVIC